MAGASNKIVKDRKTIGFIRRRHPKTQIRFRSMAHQGHDASKAEGRLQVTSILRNSTQNYRRRHYPRRSVVGGVQRPLRALVLPQQHPPARVQQLPCRGQPRRCCSKRARAVRVGGIFQRSVKQQRQRRHVCDQQRNCDGSSSGANPLGGVDPRIGQVTTKLTKERRGGPVSFPRPERCGPSGVWRTHQRGTAHALEDRVRWHQAATRD